MQEPDEQRCCTIWGSFWEKYRAITPLHPVFNKTTQQLERTAAVLVHGDEGRSKKKYPLMILSCHSVLGMGSGVDSNVHDVEPYDKQELNWTGHTAATRWLLSVLPRSMYDDERSDNYQLLLKHLVADMKELFETGLVNPLTGHTHYFCVINIIGDWPFLGKSFLWNRTFGNSAKKATAKKSPTGICHACWADKPGYPWEDFESPEPRWRQTLNRDEAYTTKPILMELPHDPADPAGFAGQDYFHGFHLGAGKIFVSSALALISSMFPGGSFPARFKAMETDLFAWCTTYKQHPYIRKFNRDTIGWPHATEAPMGGWHKGSTTLCLLRWALFLLFAATCQHRERISFVSNMGSCLGDRHVLLRHLQTENLDRSRYCESFGMSGHAFSFTEWKMCSRSLSATTTILSVHAESTPTPPSLLSAFGSG